MSYVNYTKISKDSTATHYQKKTKKGFKIGRQIDIKIFLKKKKSKRDNTVAKDIHFLNEKKKMAGCIKKYYKIPKNKNAS